MGNEAGVIITCFALCLIASLGSYCKQPLKTIFNADTEKCLLHDLLPVIKNNKQAVQNLDVFGDFMIVLVPFFTL